MNKKGILVQDVPLASWVDVDHFFDHLQICFLIEKGRIQDICQEKESRREREIVRIMAGS